MAHVIANFWQYVAACVLHPKVAQDLSGAGVQDYFPPSVGDLAHDLYPAQKCLFNRNRLIALRFKLRYDRLLKRRRWRASRGTHSKPKDDQHLASVHHIPGGFDPTHYVNGDDGCPARPGHPDKLHVSADRPSRCSGWNWRCRYWRCCRHRHRFRRPRRCHPESRWHLQRRLPL